MRHCRDCEVFENTDGYEDCPAGNGCHGVDFDCSVDHEDCKQIWCEEIVGKTCGNEIMCQDRLSERELIELLLGRTLRIANKLYDIRQEVKSIASRLERQDEEKAKEKWEREKPLRIASFEKELAELPEWVPQNKASNITHLTTSRLQTYEKHGVIKTRRDNKGHREYWKNDLLPYAEKVNEHIKSDKWENRGFLYVR